MPSSVSSRLILLSTFKLLKNIPTCLRVNKQKFYKIIVMSNILNVLCCNVSLYHKVNVRDHIKNCGAVHMECE